MSPILVNDERIGAKPAVKSVVMSKLEVIFPLAYFVIGANCSTVIKFVANSLMSTPFSEYPNFIFGVE